MCHLRTSFWLSRILLIKLDHRLPTEAARVHSQVRSCEVCGKNSDVVKCFLRLHLCPRPILKTPSALHIRIYQRIINFDSIIKIQIYIITVHVAFISLESGWLLGMVTGLVARWPGTDSRQLQGSEAQPIILISNMYLLPFCKVQQPEREADRSPPLRDTPASL
jgi:hypothetical protein